MHDTSYEKMQAFVDVHLAAFRDQPLEVLDFGSQMVDDQGLTYRTLFDAEAWTYRGLDIAAGHNVDVTVADPYDWTEVESDSVDLVISGQALEHVEIFWASMFEIVRVLRPGGLAAIIAPAGGYEHRYPVDCWRFYADGFTALARHVGCEVIDVFTDWGNGDWEDSILVAQKPLWTGAERSAFVLRSSLQRAILQAEVDLDAVRTDAEGAGAGDATSSPLRHVQRGALRAALERSRDERLAREAAHAEAEAARAEREWAEAIAAAVESAQAERRLRARVARRVGPRGRAAYRRVHGRS
jgi:SAM-dependent methyltransferase